MAIQAARLLVDVQANVDRAERDLKRLDNTLDRMGGGTLNVASKAAKAFGIAALAGFGVLGSQAVLGSTTAFVAALAPMVGLATALPGLLFAAAGAFAALKIGLSGVGDAMKTLGGTAEEFAEGIAGLAPNAQAFMQSLRGMREEASAMKSVIQDNLFAGLSGTVERLGASYLPMLTESLGGVATTMSAVANNFGNFLTKASTVADVQTMISGTSPLVAGLGEAVKDVVAAFLDLGVGGVQSLANMGDSLANTAQRFRDWAAEARETGKVQEWISEGAEAARQFGKVLGNIGGILNGVFSAGDGGSGLMANLVAMTGRVEGFVKSVEGQDALARFFASASQAASALAPVIGAAFTAFTQIAPVLANIATGIGPGLKDLLTAIGDEFSTLGPAGSSLGESMGTFLRSLIPIVPVLGDIIRNVVSAVQVIAPFGPALLGLAGAMMAVKVAASIAGTISATAGAIGAVGSAASTALLHSRNFAAGLTSGQAAASAFTGKMGTVGGAIRSTVVAFAQGVAAAARWAASIVASAARGAVALAGAVARMIASMVVWAAGMVAQGAVAVASFAVTVASVVAGWVLMGVQALAAAARMAAAWLIALGPIGWAIAAIIAVAAVVIANWDKIKEITARVWEAIGDKVKAVLGVLKALFLGWFGILRGAFQAGWITISTIFSVAWGLIVGVVKTAIGLVTGTISGMISGVRNIIQGGLAIVQGIFSGNWSQVLAGVKQMVGGLLGFMTALPRQIIGALGNLGSLLLSSGKSLIQGLINGIKAQAGAVKDAVAGVLKSARNLLPFSPAKEGPFSGKGWTLYSGRSISDALAQGLTDQAADVRRAALSVAQAAAGPLGDLGAAGGRQAGSGAPSRGSRVARPADLARPGGPQRALTLSFTTYNPVAEAQSITTNKALNRAGALGLV